MKPLVTALKIIVPLAIIGWLVWDLSVDRPEDFAALASQPKRWGLLAGGVGLVFVATCISFARWFLLVRALGLPFDLRDAFRLGFVGYLLNFISLGAVGGDLFKAIFLYREQTGRRTEAIATIFIDRVVGMLGLVLVATLVLSAIDVSHSENLQIIARGTRGIALVMTAGFIAVLIPGVADSFLTRWLVQLPKVGSLFHRAFAAVRCYQQNWGVLVIAVVLSMLIHLLIGSAIHLAAHGLYPVAPTVVEHLVMTPIANVVGALPLAPNGLGQFEGAMTYLYNTLPAEGRGQGQGIIVALAYRLMTLAVASIGMCFYWFNRKLVRELIEQADAASHTAVDAPAPALADK